MIREFEKKVPPRKKKKGFYIEIGSLISSPCLSFKALYSNLLSGCPCILLFRVLTRTEQYKRVKQRAGKCRMWSKQQWKGFIALAHSQRARVRNNIAVC